VHYFPCKKIIIVLSKTRKNESKILCFVFSLRIDKASTKYLELYEPLVAVGGYIVFGNYMPRRNVRTDLVDIIRDHVITMEKYVIVACTEYVARASQHDEMYDWENIVSNEYNTKKGVATKALGKRESCSSH
jgi:hypothetical protein